MMRITLTTILAAFITLHASAADCGRRISQSSESSARTIVLAGGDAWDLFRQFLAVVEQRNLDVSLWKTTVQLARNGHIETVRLGWANSIFASSAEQEWRDRLHGKTADIDPLLLAAANTRKWDVVCAGHIPGTEPSPAKPLTTAAPIASPPPAAVITFYKSGLQYASRGDYANALNEFLAAERISPSLDGLLMNLGVTYLQLSRYDRASEYLRRAIAQSPNNAEAHYNMACLQARLRQPDDAITSLAAARSNGLKMTAALKRDPDLASLRGRRDFEMLFN